MEVCLRLEENYITLYELEDINFIYTLYVHVFKTDNSYIDCFETFSSKIVFKFTKVYIVELSHTVCKSYILCKNVFSTSVVLLL